MLIRSNHIRPFVNKKEESFNDVSACKKVNAFMAKPSTKTSD
jgi:hypothetical protein